MSDPRGGSRSRDVVVPAGAAEIDLAELRRELLRPEGLWRAVDVVEATGSTNADLAARARLGEPSGAVLVSGYQSAGRGRQGRSWTAPPGTSLAISVLLRPAVEDANRWAWLPLVSGLAVAEGLRSCAGVPAMLKWPNDVLVRGRKISGILAERLDTAAGPACVVGMGINVSLTEEQLPVPAATSLALEVPQTPGAVLPGHTVIVATVLAALELLVRRWEATPDATALARAYRERSATIGQDVRVTLGSAGHELAVGPVEGRAVDVDADGRLVVATAHGRQIFGAGDVLHLRSDFDRPQPKHG